MIQKQSQPIGRFVYVVINYIVQFASVNVEDLNIMSL